jgi:hypothetical protein
MHSYEYFNESLVPYEEGIGVILLAAVCSSTLHLEVVIVTALFFLSVLNPQDLFCMFQVNFHLGVA